MTMRTPELTSTLPPLRLGLCQVETRPWDIEGNTSRTFRALEAAARDGAQLAITPENVLQGYPVHDTPEKQARLREIAEPPDGPRLLQTRELAAKHGMDVVIGFAERVTRGRGEPRLHNSAAYITRTGELAALYRKVHCRPFEAAWCDGLYVPGEEFAAAPCETRGTSYTIGIYICFDREIPESTRCLRAMGSQLVACPLATNTSRLDAPLSRADNEMLTRARAAENEVFIAVVNHSGSFNGGSFVVGPSGECLLQLGAEPEVRVIDLPLGAVPQHFHSNPLGWAGWAFRRPEVYDEYLGADAYTSPAAGDVTESA